MSPMRKVYDWKMELYWRMPVLLQESVLSTYAVYLDRRYYGSTYAEWVRKLGGQSKWSYGESAEWQNRRLQFILRLAAARVPYYREQWRDLDWQAVRTTADLQALPLLDKHAIRQ